MAASLVDPRRPVWDGCPFFLWEELEGWDQADAVRVARARQLVRDFLCPARAALGPITVTSWYTWSSGRPRDEVHGQGAAIDLVPERGTVQRAYEWIRDHTVYGEVIQERTHVHVTLPGFGGSMSALLEPREGVYVADPDAAPFSRAAVDAGLHTVGGLLLIGAAVGVWRSRQ